jgi:hypothetical protein
MNGNFSRLNLQGGGAKVQVRGWLDWRDGGDSAKLSVTVTQGMVTAISDAPLDVTNGDTTWETTASVVNGGTFQEGIAAGQAGAVVKTGPAETSQSWNSGPLLIS